MGWIDEKKKMKKDKILESAFSLFKEKGIEETSVSDITKAAGMAKGTFYLYFKDKYALYEILVFDKSNLVFKRAYDEGEKIRDSFDDEKDHVFFLINHIIDQLANDKDLLKFITKNLSWGLFKKAMLSSGDDPDEYANIEKIFSSFLYNEGNPMFKNPELMIYMIIELISSTIYSVILEGEPVCLDDLKPTLFGTIDAIINQQKIAA